MDEKNLLNRVEQNPQIMFGKPVIKGTRLPIEIIVEKMAYGYTILKIIKEYPFITEEDIKAALLFAAKVVSREEVYSF